MDGDAGELRLTGTPPSTVATSLRTLQTLGLLTPNMVWELMSQTQVDPLFLIRTLRQNKKALGFKTEEHHIGDSLAFLAGDKTELGHKVAYHVHVFSNDITVMVRDTQGYTQHSWMSAEDLLNDLKAIQAGDARLARLLTIVKGHVDAGLAYSV